MHSHTRALLFPFPSSFVLGPGSCASPSRQNSVRPRQPAFLLPEVKDSVGVFPYCLGHVIPLPLRNPLGRGVLKGPWNCQAAIFLSGLRGLALLPLCARRPGILIVGGGHKEQPPKALGSAPP